MAKTALSRQLQALQTSAPAHVSAIRQAKSSLLFSAEELSNYEIDDIFQIGVKGLQQLTKIDTKFSGYETSLFSVESKKFQRLVETKETNRNVSKILGDFLSLVSPYMHLLSAQEALEWLVFRYRVHEFEPDSFLGCILPHHDSKIFVRALQLLSFKEPTHKYHWLYGTQKNGTFLAKSMICTRVASDMGFLKFILSIWKNILKAHEHKPEAVQSIISFVTSTVMGSLENTPVFSEVQTSTIVNAIAPRISSRTDAQSRAGALMILGQLARKAILSTAVLEMLVLRLSEDIGNVSSLKMLVILYQYQQATLTSFPQKSLSFLHENASSFVEALNSIAIAGFHIHPFISILVGELVKYLGFEDARCKSLQETLSLIVNEVRLHQKDAASVISAMIEVIVEHLADNDYTSLVTKLLKSLLMTCERVYSVAYDQALRAIFQRKDESEPRMVKAKEKLCSILGFDSSLIEGDGTTLFMKMHNPDYVIRQQSVAALVDSLNSGKIVLSDSVMECIIDALEDSNPNVVSEALKIGSSVLQLPVEKVALALKKVLTPCKAGDPNLWSEAEEKAVFLLCNVLYSSEKTSKMVAETMLLLVPHFFNEGSPILRGASESVFAKDFPIICELASAKIDKRLKIIRKSQLFMSDKESYNIFIEKAVNLVGTTGDAVTIVSHLLILSTEDLPVKQASCIIETLLAKSNEVVDMPISLKEDGTLHLQKLMNDIVNYPKISTELLLHFCTELIRKKSPAPCKGMQLHKFLENEEQESPLRLFGLCLYLWMNLILCRPKSVERRKNYMNQFISTVAASPKEQLNLLMPFWAGHLSSTPVPLAIQIQAMVLSVAVLKRAKDNSLLLLSSPVIPSLLCSLSSESPSVRKMAMTILSEISDTFSGITSDSYKILVDALLERKDELLADESQLPIIIYGVFSQEMLSAIDKKKIETIKEFIFSEVLSHEVAYHVKAGLLLALQLVFDQEYTILLLDLAKNLLTSSKSAKLSSSETMTLKLILQRYQPEVAGIIDTGIGWEVFCTCVKQSEEIFKLGHEKFSAGEIILRQVNKEFFVSLPDDCSRSKLLLFLFDVLSSEEISGEGANRIRKCIKHLVIDASVVVPMFAVKSPEANITVRSTAVVSRKGNAPRLDADLNFKRIMVALETFQNKRRIHQTHLLVEPLMQLLRRCVSQPDPVAYEYSKQLTLSCLHSFITKMEAEELSKVKVKIDVDLLVRCINFSNNPQTHHHALLLLSQAARLFPEIVLEKMMSIFTSMGNTILKRDDDYSLQVIDKTLTALIPELIKANEDPNDPAKLNNIINNIVAVFAKSIHETPRYRQIVTFNRLLSIIGPENHLWLGPAHLMQIAAAQVDQAKRNQIRKSALEVFTLFDVTVQLKAVHDLLVYVNELPLDLDANKSTKPVFGPWTFVGEKTELRCAAEMNFLISFRSNILQFLAYLLQSRDLLERLVDDTPGIDTTFSALVTAVTAVIRRLDEFHARKGRKLEKIKGLLNQAQDVMDKINSLLKSDMFLEVIFNLLKSTPDMQKRALDLFVVKLEVQPAVFADESRISTLTSISNWLIKFVNESTNCAKSAETTALNLQSALNVLLHVSHVFSLDSTARVIPILALSSSLVTKSDILPVPVLGQTLLCLGEGVRLCGASALVEMTSFMPHLLRILQENPNVEGNELLLTAAISSLQKIVDTLPQFLSPYLMQLLAVYCHFSALHKAGSATKKPEKPTKLHSELMRIKVSLAANVPVRSLVPCLEVVYKELNNEEKQHLFALMQETFKNTTKEDVVSEIENLTNFYIESLNFRNIAAKTSKVGKKKRKLEEYQLSEEDVDNLELSVAHSLVSMVMKLPEIHFRPLYFKLYDWMHEDDNKERMLTFYRISDMIAEKIKGLFSLFAGQIVKHVADLLNELSKQAELFEKKNDEKSDQLLIFLLCCLMKLALYDNEQFFNKDRFDLLMKPIVNQLENPLCGEAKASSRIENLVAPLIGQFAIALADDILWKDLHYEILLKMRDERSWVKMGALKAYSSFVTKLGKDDYLPLLPEAIPFLAELLEDTDNAVEVLAQQIIQETEIIVEEPLKDYF